ncbi:hypothetical protein CLU79DRAFT_738782 [Phycomyces nitens]|nr:hypothetical protein CLU79DRAFT_738782 [Phycomyces nitens]
MGLQEEQKHSLMAAILLDILLDNHSIDLWGQHSPFYFQGTVELTLNRPIHIREISVGIKGVLQSIVSTDFPDRIFKENIGVLDHSHFKKHPTQKPKLVAMGYAESRQTILRTNQVVLRCEIPGLYTPDTYRWPFSLMIENPHVLPPTILLPRHNIHYQLTAHISLGSGDRLRMSCWHAYQSARKHASIAYQRLSNPLPLSDQDVSLPNHPPPPYYPTPHQVRHCLLSTLVSLQVNQYSLYNHFLSGSRRYRGTRLGVLCYEACLPNNAWIGRTRYEFMCEFYLLRQDVTIDKIVSCVEQSEKYPVQSGKVQSGHQLGDNNMMTRIHCYSETHHHISLSDDLSCLSLFVPLNSPLLSQDISATSLRIEHRLRLIVHFGERAHERKMTLSFPLLIGAMDQTGCNQWTNNNDSQNNEESNNLPSYRSAVCDPPPVCNL